MLCDDLEVWDGKGVGARLQREGMYVYTQLIHFVVQQKLMQHCKAFTPIKKRKQRYLTLYHDCGTPH